MTELDTSGWGEFVLGDIAEVIKGRRLRKQDMTDGDYPHIGASSMNNGITRTLGNEDQLFDSHCLTVAYDGSIGESFYQYAPFWASDAVNVVRVREDISRFSYFFLASVLRKIGKGYTYKNKWTSAKMKAEVIKLPITNAGEPDWDFMDSYMSQTMDRVTERVQTLQRVQLQNQVLDASDWGEFKVGDLFEKLERGRVKSVSALDDGDIPYIGAVVSNNGQSRSVTVDDSLIFEGNAIVLIQTGQGGIGLNTYQKEPFAAHANVAVGYNQRMNELSGLFVVSCLNQSVNVFSYDYSTGRNLKKETVKLPITDTGEPDWDFMESYMMRMMDQVSNRAQKLKDMV